MFGQLLRKENGPMLPPGTTERDHQVLETAGLIVIHAGIDKRENVCEILVNTVILIEILDHGTVFACEGIVAFLASRIRQTAKVEDESPSVAALIFGEALME